MSEKTYLQVVLGGKSIKQVADLVEQAESEWEALRTIQAFEAKRKKLIFDELVKAGFTESQALQLIK